MLERLNQILERLDHPAGHPSSQHLPETTSVAHPEPSPVSSISHLSQVHETEPVDFLNEYMKIPSSRTTADAVLLWPIFEGKYPPNLLIDSLLEVGIDAESDNEDEPGSRIPVHPRSSLGGKSLSSANVEENVLRLVDNFIANVHTKNPILDVGTLKRYARGVAEDGPGWDGKSCLVVSAFLCRRSRFDISQITSEPSSSCKPRTTCRQLFDFSDITTAACMMLADEVSASGLRVGVDREAIFGLLA